MCVCVCVKMCCYNCEPLRPHENIFIYLLFEHIGAPSIICDKLQS